MANRTAYISHYLQKPKTILFFLQNNNINIESRIRRRNKILDEKTNINDNEKLSE